MNLEQRMNLLARLGEYILSDDKTWQQAKEKASSENSWFIPEFVEKAAASIATCYLQKEILQKWTSTYRVPANNPDPKTVGIVMAGNIPLVGFHDWLCVFISGHRALVKTSSKDNVLIRHLVEVLVSWNNAVAEQTVFAERLNNCNAYIATGSNNSAGYFDYYFGRYPHIIRRNRTAVAILTGEESRQELELLADDVYLYFGFGCRNVTKLYIPSGYDFIELLTAFSVYDRLGDYHKFRNNYDYNLALHILNRKFYMSNKSILLLEDDSFFSPIAQVHYGYYDNKDNLIPLLQENTSLQCIVGRGFVPFGGSQLPSVSDYADGVDTLAFLLQIS